MFYPAVGNAIVKELDLVKLGSLTFKEPNLELFPSLEICRQAGISGEGASIAISAADEILVDSFLKGKINFLDIPKKLEKVLTKFDNIKDVSFDDILFVDNDARKYTYSLGV